MSGEHFRIRKYERVLCVVGYTSDNSHVYPTGEMSEGGQIISNCMLTVIFYNILL